ncbi:MAG: hypothetical protein J0I92_07420, partial [Phyllobacterium sp.]|nr:hypothetical protein [Phyllobacterium sp.]
CCAGGGNGGGKLAGGIERGRAGAGAAAPLLAFGAAPMEIVSALGPLADDDAGKQSQIDQIRAMIAEFKSSGNLVMMTDRANITALTGIVPRPTEAVVVSPPAAGETVHIAGRIIFD